MALTPVSVGSDLYGTLRTPFGEETHVASCSYVEGVLHYGDKALCGAGGQVYAGTLVPGPVTCVACQQQFPAVVAALGSASTRDLKAAAKIQREFARRIRQYESSLKSVRGDIKHTTKFLAELDKGTLAWVQDPAVARDNWTRELAAAVAREAHLLAKLQVLRGEAG